jgi:serine/threonine protein kinase
MISKIITDNGLAYDVVSIMNRGSQGTIYKLQRKDKTYAAKIYHSVSNESWENVKHLSLQGAPSFSEVSSYVWPLHIISSPDRGFIMEYVDLKDYRSVNQLHDYKMFTVVDRMKVSIEMMKSLLALHLKTGKIFGDLSPNNVLINIKNYSIKIFDVDSIGTKQFDVAGTSGYMSRKTLIEQKPSFESDVFAMYVLVHELIFNKHPYDGRFTQSFTTYEEGINQAILSQKHYIFEQPDHENSVDSHDQRTKAIWDYFIPDSLKNIILKMFQSEISLELVIEQFEHHVQSTHKCRCGGQSMTTTCTTCYQPMETE